jgi:hypothetical protein
VNTYVASREKLACDTQSSAVQALFVLRSLSTVKHASHDVHVLHVRREIVVNLVRFRLRKR